MNRGEVFFARRRRVPTNLCITAIQHDKNVISASWFRYSSTAKVRDMDVRAGRLSASGRTADLGCVMNNPRRKTVYVSKNVPKTVSK